MSKSTYHHGNLANALIAAAMQRVEHDGAEAVSLRELAHSLQVSRAAPYRHFSDRDALLVAVAAEGFEALIADYMAALETPGDGRTKLWALNEAFLDFAIRRAGLYKLMFASDLLSREPLPDMLVPLAAMAYRLLWRAVEGAYPGLDATEVKTRTVIMISTVHGFLDLDRAGRFRPFMYEPLDRDDLVRAVMRAAIGEYQGPRAIIEA